MFPQLFRVLDRNTEYMFSIFFRKQRDEKKENNLLTLIVVITTLTVRASSVFLTNQRACFLRTKVIYNFSAQECSILQSKKIVL